MNLQDIFRDILFEKMGDSFIFRNAYLTLNIANGVFPDKEKNDSLPYAKFSTERRQDHTVEDSGIYADWEYKE